VLLLQLQLVSLFRVFCAAGRAGLVVSARVAVVCAGAADAMLILQSANPITANFNADGIGLPRGCNIFLGGGGGGGRGGEEEEEE
jgi:hypothetical protein